MRERGRERGEEATEWESGHQAVGHNRALSAITGKHAAYLTAAVCWRCLSGGSVCPGKIKPDWLCHKCTEEDVLGCYCVQFNCRVGYCEEIQSTHSA